MLSIRPIGTKVVNRATQASVRCLSSKLQVVNYDNSSVSIKFENDKVVQFNNVFMRDSCQSPRSVDPFSRQKLFTTAEISKNLKINGIPSIQVDDKTNTEKLIIEWNQNGKIHKSEYSEQFLTKFAQKENHHTGKFFDKERLLWDESLITKNLDELWSSYPSYVKSDQEFFKVVQTLNKFGFAFINEMPDVTHDVPVSEENFSTYPISDLASKFGYIKKTFYGTLFEVKNEKEDAKNIANTNTFLPLHMDLLYYESPPGLQLLHFIQNSTEGGENIFSDSFLAAQHVHMVDPDAYYALTKVPITYHYDNNNEHYFYKRPLIVEDNELRDSKSPFQSIKEVNYAPPFQGPLEFGITGNNSSLSDIEQADALAEATLFKDFLRGFAIFEEFINDPKNHYEIKMPENSCVIFDNRRVLHSRNGFSDANGGDRWLIGCYVDGDSFRSKLRIGFRSLK
ncbi:gamma-butyrobetaine dioxygenase [Scheffersomyces coipomensis]|uniref:gamma-butyrobetaine dioxygenase n=1 Tax=Scheffersomyces coipomensis TaxID=1788519 RepID=UPI00315C837D